MEGLTYRLALVYETLLAQLPDLPQVVISGGAVQKSAYLASLLADVLETPITCSSEAEPSARGVALLALEALGLPLPEEAVRQQGQVFEPRLERTRIYREAMARQQELYEAVEGGDRGLEVNGEGRKGIGGRAFRRKQINKRTIVTGETV
jgi:sugar (pentulose or hexulose) kinase